MRVSRLAGQAALWLCAAALAACGDSQAPATPPPGGEPPPGPISCPASGGLTAAADNLERTIGDKAMVFETIGNYPGHSMYLVLRGRTGADTIPVLVASDDVLVGEEAIQAYLSAQVPVPRSARAHRLKAEKARRRYLEEECECSQPVTR